MNYKRLRNIREKRDGSLSGTHFVVVFKKEEISRIQQQHKKKNGKKKKLYSILLYCRKVIKILAADSFPWDKIFTGNEKEGWLNCGNIYQLQV